MDRYGHSEERPSIEPLFAMTNSQVLSKNYALYCNIVHPNGNLSIVDGGEFLLIRAYASIFAFTTKPSVEISWPSSTLALNSSFSRPADFFISLENFSINSLAWFSA